MSEVIETYIRRHPELSEKEAFEGFLSEERIQAWIGNDASRRERLRAEFGRVWGRMHVAGQVGSNARSGPSGPNGLQAPRTLRVEVRPEAAESPAQAAAMPTMGPGARKLDVMCTACRRVDVWMKGETIACRTCGHLYDDMLQLIRVSPVGPFEFLFGEGWVGYATAGGIAGGLALLYFLLRGF